MPVGSFSYLWPYMLYGACTVTTILVIIKVHHLFNGVLDTACVYFRRCRYDVYMWGEKSVAYLHECNGNADFTSTNMIVVGVLTRGSGSQLVNAACFLVPDDDARGNTVTHGFILVPAAGPYV